MVQPSMSATVFSDNLATAESFGFDTTGGGQGSRALVGDITNEASGTVAVNYSATLRR